jgi:hypothetical protein
MENELIQVEENVKDLSSFRKNGNVNVGTFTNVEDKKELFNLQSHVDFILNDCVGEKIRIKKVLVRTFDKPMKEPIVDEETGEVLKEIERSVSCVLIDDSGKSYATGSKTFTYNLMNYLTEFDGATELETTGINIEIIKVPTPTGNKALSFKLI